MPIAPLSTQTAFSNRALRRLAQAAGWLLAGSVWAGTPPAAVAEPAAASAPAAEEVPALLVPAERLSTLKAKTDRKLARIARKQARANMPTYAFPQEAMAFYANKRTGPIETRGSNPTTGIRPLDPKAYLDAIAAERGKPQFSSRSNRLLGAASARAAAAPGALLGTWQPLGPSNQGGRTRQLLIDPNDPSVMYAAAVGGGVWKSLDAGASWDQLTDLRLPNIAVASLAMDPRNSQVLYAGTGEGLFNGDAIRGTGIFKSSDGGASWSAVASTVPPAGVAGDFSYVYNIVVSTRNSNRIYASTRTGVFRSNDGGTTWTRLIDGLAVNGCHDIVMQTKRAVGYVYVSCGTFANTGAAIYRALDTAGSSFASVFSTSDMGRTSLAIAPSDENYIYAMVASASNDGLRGIFRSTAGGASGSWETRVDASVPASTVAEKLNRLQLSNPVFGVLSECGFGPSAAINQGWYDNVLAVDPVDPNRVWAGGVDLMRSDDGGRNWGVASYWWFTQGVDPEYSHADAHVIRFHPKYDGVSNKIMYTANDGGVYRTLDARANVGTSLTNFCGNPVAGRVTWTPMNTNYTTTQFYHGSAYPDGETYFGGLQDNGTMRGSSASSAWQEIQGGDGGYTAVDTRGDSNPSNDVLFATFTGNSLQRSTDGGATFSAANTGITGGGFLFIAPFAMNSRNPQQLWTGGFDVWRSTNQANTWQRAGAAGATPGTGSISAVAIAPTNPNRVLLGFSDGYVARSAVALSLPPTGIDWITNSVRPRTAFVSSIAFDPGNDLIAYLTYTTFSGVSVYKTLDGGASWVALPGSGSNVLPRVPAHTVVVNPADSQRLYVGTDIGVYTSLDGGANWFKEVTGFGNVSVEHLEFNSAGPVRRLFAFTHGRGAWRVDLNP